MTPIHHTVVDQNGRMHRFDELYDLHFDDIFRYILHRVGQVADAQDITAQTFFKALRNLHRFHWKKGSFKSWLYRIATNETNTYFRRTGPAHNLEDIQEPVSGVHTDDELHRAEAELTKNRVFKALNQAIRKLKPEDQSLIVFRYLEKKPFAEIAEILGKKQGMVTMRTHRALKKLKTELESKGIGYERFRESFEGNPTARHSRAPIQTGIAP